MSFLYPRDPATIAVTLIEIANLVRAMGQSFAARIDDQREKILAAELNRIGDLVLAVVNESIQNAMARWQPRW